MHGQDSKVYQRQDIGKEELNRLVDMLDKYEINIAVSYLSNLLLSRVHPNANGHRHSS